MSVGIDKLASELQKVIEEKDKNKKTPYDTEAEVVRVDTEVVWVKIPGGVDETPVQKTVNAKVGDTVQVRVTGGRAFLVGNGTNPPTDDTVANVAIDNARDANQNATAAGMAAEQAIESANQANEKAIEATEFATQAKTQAGEATEAANEAKAQASAATTAANQAKTQAAEAETAANEAKTSAAEATTAANEAKTQASEATTAANQAKDDAAKANTAANGAVTSLGIVQGVVDGLSVDMDEMRTHVAMMDAVVDPDSGKTLVPAGLHVVPTNNGYFVVLSNDGMYVYDNESDLVAIFGENIKFDSIRPQRIGGDDAYIEYYDSNHDGKADSLRIVGANISSSTGIPTKVSELQNDSGYTTKTYVDDAVGDTATDLANYILSNDKAIDDLERQIDGAIDTWYYAGDPTTSNEPAKDWTTEALKESHLRDLYFNTSNGHTFRWAKEGNTYKWIQIEDADAIKALADAAKAQTTADVKKRVFIAQPTPPYDVGDLWVGGSNGDIKKCKKAKTEGQSYAASDWELASKYTDDSNLNSYKTEVSNTYSTKVEVQQTESTLEGKITAAETSSKSYADGLIEQEVSDRNTAIQASADGITTSVSQNYTKTVDLANTDAVKAAKKAGTDAQSALNSYKTTNDAAVAAAKKAGDDAQADLDDYKDTVQETYATKTQLTQTESSIKSEVSSTYATKSSVPTKVSQLTNDSKYATQTQAQGYANTAESNAKADATTKANAAEANAKADATTKANAAEANAKADTTEKLKSYSTTTQMNSAIEQKANSIALSVSEEKIAELISTKEVSGSIVHVEDASEYPALDCKISLEPIQDLNGYDHPWVGGAGKNKFKNYGTDGTTAGVTYTMNEDGSIKCVGTVGGTSAKYLDSASQSKAMNLDIGVSYTISGGDSVSADGIRLTTNIINSDGSVARWIDVTTKNGVAFTLTEGQSLGSVYLRGQTTGKAVDVTLYPMVRKSSESADWEPYENICPISGHTEVNTHRTGKNLCDNSIMAVWEMVEQDDGSWYADNDKLYDKVLWKNSHGISGSLKVIFKYRYSTSEYVGAYLRIKYTDGTIEKIIGTRTTSFIETSLATNASKTVEEIRFTYSSNGVQSYVNVMVTTDLNVTSYEPYQGDTYTSTLGRTVYGGTLDVVSGVLTVDRAFVTITSSTESMSMSGGNKRAYLWAGIPTPKKPTSASEVLSNLISNYLTAKSDKQTYNGTVGVSVGINGYLGFTLTGNAMTLDEVKTYLASNPLQVCYKLATPQTYQLTPRQVELLAGTNNVWSDSGDTYLKYITMNSDMLSLMDKSNADLSRAKAEIKVTTDGISSEVAKKVGDSEIISKINQSAETVKIQASKVEIDGAATFNAIKAKADAAYDAKGAASTVQKDIEGVAVQEEQYIYISKASGTASVSGTTTWITEAGDKQNTWSTKRPTYNSSYPVLFVAKQKKVVSGTVTCTTPVKDDTTTIIDGGHITTGTIDASKATIKNISASMFTSSEQEKILNSKIEIGGRNLVWDTEWKHVSTRWSDWGSPTIREIVTINGKRWLHLVTTASSYQGYSQAPDKRNGYGEIKAGDKVIISYSAYAKTAGQTCTVGCHWRNSSGTIVAQNWFPSTLTTTEKRYTSGVFTIPNDAVGFNVMVGDGTANAQELWISQVKIEFGTKATDWTPAPEDIQSNAEDYADTVASIAKAELDATKIDAVGESTSLLDNINAISDQITLLASRINFGNITVADNLAQLNTAVSIDTATSTVYVGDQSSFHVRINGTELGFYQRAQRVAYINNNQLYITQSVVLQQMDLGTPVANGGLGQWSWKVHPNGKSPSRNNLNLKWIG